MNNTPPTYLSKKARRKLRKTAALQAQLANTFQIPDSKIPQLADDAIPKVNTWQLNPTATESKQAVNKEVLSKPNTNKPGAAGKKLPAANWADCKTVYKHTKTGGMVKYKINTTEKSDQASNAAETNKPDVKVNEWTPVTTASAVSGGQTAIAKFGIAPQQGVAKPAQPTQTSKPTPTAKPTQSAKPSQPPKPNIQPPNPNIQPPNPNTQTTPSQLGSGIKPLMSTIPVLEGQERKPQPSKVRMTASSFMQTSGKVQQNLGTAGIVYPIIYPAGIPKSFIYEQMNQAKIDYLTQSPQTGSNQTPAPAPIWEVNIGQTATWHPVGQQELTYDQTSQPNVQRPQADAHGQMFVQTDDNDGHPKQRYSPSDPYADITMNEANDELQDESMSQDSYHSGSKRLSAFQRLGPVTQAKKPKLTINLLFNKEQAVRKVEEEKEVDPDKYTPVQLKPDVQTSLDDTVIKYLLCWPWRKPLSTRRSVTARTSKSVMMMELEQMEEVYDKDSMFIQVSVTGYPESWSKEDVLDTVLESVKGKSFIPCFIEFARDECKFLVIRSRSSLTAIHKFGFVVTKEDVKLVLSIKQLSIGVQQIDFIPRLILRKRLLMAMEGETELNLTEFTTKSDISHFIYFPLNRVSNQTELIQLQSSVPWENLTKLDLSHNRITSLSGFDLVRNTPRLKHLDLSYNYIEGISTLLHCRGLPLTCIALEGNPMCTDYIEQERYIKVLKMILPELKEIDGVKLTIPGTFPPWVRNYCPPEALNIISKVLEVLYPLLDAEPEERQRIEDLYDFNAVMTVTFMHKLRYGPIFKDYRGLFSRARVVGEGDAESIEGSAAIAKLIYRWPKLHHDPTTFTVDVMYHTETTTIFKVSGIMRVTTESLADDEHLLSFSRTLVLHSLDSIEFKITNEMIYWDLPYKEKAKEAFRMTTGRNHNVSLKLEAPPNEELKEKLLLIFMKLTEMERKPSERCLEMKDWHFKNALEHFAKLLKIDNLGILYS